jgi:hypothetical protein
MKKSLFRILLISLAAASAASCARTYFADATNYQVFVPGILDNTVADCHVLVYDSEGNLVRMRHAAQPFDNDPRIATGNISFALLPGEYTVFCYTDAGDLLFADTDRLETASLNGKKVEHVAAKNKFANYTDDAYARPPALSYQRFLPVIHGIKTLHVDTLDTERLTGRITVRFNNCPGDIARVTHVQLITHGVGTRQPLARDTLFSRFGDNDYLFIDELPVRHVSATALEIDYDAFPSLPEQTIVLHLKFLDARGDVVSTIPVDLLDPGTRQPLRLLRGRRIVLEMDTYTVIRMKIVKWDETISNFDREL